MRFTVVGKSYRRLRWLPYSIVEKHKNQSLKCFLNKGGMKLAAGDVIDDSWSLVDRILDERCTYGGGVEYYVKWQNLSYSDSTWEPEDSLADDKVMHLLEQLVLRITLEVQDGLVL